MRSNNGTELRIIHERCLYTLRNYHILDLTCCHFGSSIKGLKGFSSQRSFRERSIVMDFERELRELAQTHLEHIQDIQWHDLRRAVVTHLESMEENDTLPYARIPPRQVCHHILNNRPCPKWKDGTACGATWHPEFVQILDDGNPTWIWMPRQTICRTNQRSLGVRHPQGPFTCTDPNCLRAHAPNWLYAELWAFRWYVQHEFHTGLGTGYTLNGDLIGVSARAANLTLATMPYVDEAYYHRYRWHAPIPQPEAYGDMMVTATSRRANLNERGLFVFPQQQNAVGLCTIQILV